MIIGLTTGDRREAEACLAWFEAKSAEQAGRFEFGTVARLAAWQGDAAASAAMLDRIRIDSPAA